MVAARKHQAWINTLNRKMAKTKCLLFIVIDICYSRKTKQCLCLYSWSLIARQLQTIVVSVVAFANIILSLRKNEENEAINLLLGW